MPTKATPGSPSELIDARIEELGDWRGEMLSRVRRLIKEAVPEVTEEWKWRGVPVWYHDGMICTGESYKNYVKVTFAKGASLEDPAGLFNASLDGNARRAIDLHEGDTLDAKAFTSIVRAAADLNGAKARPRAKAGKGPTSTAAKKKSASKSAEPKLLSGGNPQIPKGEGDAPVQAYIAAMPGWKRRVGEQLDTLIERTVPNVRKAVKWNTPFYGIEGQGWFVAFHCFAKYVKVTFFKGVSLEPLPPVDSKDQDTRYFHIYEADQLDEDLIANWIKQASELPGWVTSDIG